MTTPPPGETPDDERPPSGYRPPGRIPPEDVPPGYPSPPPGAGGYPYSGPPPRPGSRISVGMAFLGSALYFVLNFVLGFAIFGMAASYGNGMVVLGAVVLALIAFGGGTALLVSRSSEAKGLGLGLMIGWAITSLVTVGLCTGLNPVLYS